MTVQKSPPARHRRWRGGRAFLVIAILGALSFATASPASAATSSSLRYSTDGGATWSTSATVAAGGTVLVRQWYDNTGSATETAASLRTTVPSGFTLQGGSTKLCLNPSTTNPSSPSAAEQKCANSAEGSVWSGSNLQISPSAGYYGESTGSTSGSAAYGRKRYFNLHQCVYFDSTTVDLLSTFNNAISNTIYRANTNVANTADTTESCAGGNSFHVLHTGHSGVQALDLLGNRYLNVHQCVWLHSTQGDLYTTATNGANSATFHAGTNTANTANTSESCGGGTAPWAIHTGHSGIQAFDLVGNRYLNLHECGWGNSSSGEQFTVLTDGALSATFRSGSNAGSSPDTTVSCAAGSSPWSRNTSLSAVGAYDLLDTTRGAGYVQYALAAPASPSPAACAGTFSGTEAFTQDATYQSAQTSTQTSTGNLTVDFSALSDPCPTDPIPAVDPVIGGVIVATAGAGYLLYRQQRTRVA